MARSKNNPSNTDNNARIKVVFFEAENINGDLTGVINAFANAIRSAPTQVIVQQPPSALVDSEKVSAANPGVHALPLTEDEDNTIEGTSISSTPEKQPRERKPFKGKILDDISWEGDGTPFVDYIKQKNPQDTMKKYLVISAWFKRHGGYGTINANLIYNAYRKVGWSVVADITQPFRHGANSKSGYFHSEGKGNYTITNIGLDAADRVGSDKQADEI